MSAVLVGLWPCRHAYHDLARRDIAHNHRTRANDRAAADRQRRHNACADADECIGADYDATAHRRTGGDVRVLTDDAIVLDNRPSVDDRMGLDPCARVNHRPRPDKHAAAQCRSRGDRGVRVYDRGPGVGRGGQTMENRPTESKGADAQDPPPPPALGPRRGKIARGLFEAAKASGANCGPSGPCGSHRRGPEVEHWGLGIVEIPYQSPFR